MALTKSEREELRTLREATAALALEVKGLIEVLEENYAKKSEVRNVAAIAESAEGTAVVATTLAADAKIDVDAVAGSVRRRSKAVRRIALALPAFAIILGGMAWYGNEKTEKVEAANRQTEVEQGRLQMFQQRAYEACVVRDSQTLLARSNIAERIRLERRYPSAGSAERIANDERFLAAFPRPNCEALKLRP